MTQEDIEAMEEQEHFSNVIQSFAYYFIYSSKIYTRMHTDWTTIPEAHKKYAIIFIRILKQIPTEQYPDRSIVQLLTLLIRLTADQPERLKTLRACAKDNAKFLDKVIENDRIFENENYVRPIN